MAVYANCVWDGSQCLVNNSTHRLAAHVEVDLGGLPPPVTRVGLQRQMQKNVLAVFMEMQKNVLAVFMGVVG
jgi:hypothetical protein